MPLAAAYQDNVHKDYKDTPALWSMCWMNFWCSLYNGVYLFVATSAGWELLSFCRECPEVHSPVLAAGHPQGCMSHDPHVPRFISHLCMLQVQLV